MFLLSFCKKHALIIIAALLILLSTITGFIRLSNIAYYVGIALFALFIFSNIMDTQIKSRGIILFMLICAISILFNSPPSYFNSWNRFFVYSAILVVISPVINSIRANVYRNKLFIIILSICSILSVGSFFAFFFGINYFVIDNKFVNIQAGTFAGLLNHSMALGPIAALCSLFLLVCTLKLYIFKYKVFCFIGMVCCLGATLLSASRIAVVSVVLGILVILFFYYRGNITKYIKKGIVIFIVGVSTFSIWGGLTDFVVQKQTANEKQGSALFSRGAKIEARIKEFTSSPIYGIGFCVVDPRYDAVNKLTGQIEPGSSWLTIASMTGLLGLITFLSIVVSSFKKVVRIKNDFFAMLFAGCLTFFIFHMLAEGYIMAPGSYLNFIFWLLIGSIWGVYFIEHKGLEFKNIWK